VQAPLYDFDAFCSLIGFEEVWAFENKYAALEAESA
jgi:2,3-dimethylmalate lyase